MNIKTLLWGITGAIFLITCEPDLDLENNQRLLIQGQLMVEDPSETEGLSVEYVAAQFNRPPSRLEEQIFLNPESYRSDFRFQVLGETGLDAQAQYRMISLEARNVERTLGINLPGSPQYDANYVSLLFSGISQPIEAKELLLPEVPLERVLNSRFELSRTAFTEDTLDISIRYFQRLKSVNLQESEQESLDLRQGSQLRLLPGEGTGQVEFLTLEGVPLELNFIRRNGGILEEGQLMISPDSNQMYRHVID